MGALRREDKNYGHCRGEISKAHFGGGRRIVSKVCAEVATPKLKHRQTGLTLEVGPFRQDFGRERRLRIIKAAAIEGVA